MAQLFQLTELETRVGFNMNVLDATQTPRVMNLAEVLGAFLDHRHVVLKRTTAFRLGKIENRIEVLGGYLAAYGNLDLVIKIIREEDKPKPKLMKALGRHKTGRSCLHIKKLDDVDIDTLEKLIEASVEHVRTNSSGC